MKELFKIVGIFLPFVIFTHNIQAQQVHEPPANHYAQGIRLFDKGLYPEAEKELRRFSENHRAHDLRYSAQYYIARSRAHIDSANKKAYYEQYIQKHPYSHFTSKLLFDLANDAKDKRQYAQASHYYERAVRRGVDPLQAPQANYWMADASASAKHYNRARLQFLALADKYPHSDWAPKALYARGRLYLSEAKYDSSTIAFELLKERYPNDKMTRRIGTALGESYYKQGKYPEAIKALKKALPYLENDSKSKAVLLIAESYNYLEKFDEASDSYLQYINMNKGTDKVRNAHYGLGWVYYKQKIYHWAADEFGKAAKGSDKLARKALYYKAVNQKLGSQYAEALKTFRNFGKRFKKGVWVEKGYYEWAMTAYEMGIYGESVEVLLKLVRGDEPLSWKGKIYNLLGESYFANKEYTRSLQAFDAAAKVTDVDPSVRRQARFRKAWVMYNNQAYKQSQPIFESLNKEYPQKELGQEALFWSADANYHMKKFGPASAQFSQFIRQYPNHKLVGPANYSLGWSYFKMGAYQKAVEPFKNFLNNYKPPKQALYPYDTDTRLRIGDSYYAQGDYAKAISFYKKAMGAEPGGDYALFQIANSYYRAEKTYEGVTTFRKFLRIYPQSRLKEQAQYNIAYIYLNSGNYTQAVKEFKTVINKYPNTSWAARSQYNIGDAFYNAGDYNKAIAAYQKVMKKYPKSDYIIEAVNGIQYAQISAGRKDSSSAELEDFIADNPQSTMADRLRYRQADTKMQSGDYQGAVKEFSQYIRITNNQKLLPDAHYNLANAYEQTGNSNKAVSEYQTVVNDYPKTDRAAAALASLGRITYSQGNYAKSLEYYEKLLPRGKDYKLEAHIGMGNAQLALNNIDDAQKQYQQALDIDNSYDAAKIGLGKIAIDQNDYEKALSLLQPIAKENTTEVGAEAQYLTGTVHQKQGSYKKALKDFSNVNVLYEAFDSWVAKSLLKKAECYIQLGQRGDARKALNSLKDEYPETPQARKAQKLLNTGN